MDYLILRIVNSILRSGATRIRTLLGSVIGAAGICMIVLLPVQIPVLNFILTHILLDTIMLKVGCKIKDVRKLIKGVLTLYVSTYLCGGILETLIRYTGYTFFWLSGLTYLFIQIGIKLYEGLKRREANLYEVTLSEDGKHIKIKGLYDTGNQLMDPYTRKPVHVVNEEVLTTLLNEEPILLNQKLKPHYIPYHSLGNQIGTILVITIDALCVHRLDEELPLIRPMIALAKESVASDDRYQMILNPSQMNE